MCTIDEYCKNSPCHYNCEKFECYTKGINDLLSNSYRILRDDTCNSAFDAREIIREQSERLKGIKTDDVSVEVRYKAPKEILRNITIGGELDKLRDDIIDGYSKWLVEIGALGNRVIYNGDIVSYGDMYAEKYKDYLKEGSDNE